ncbi:MAG: hypothetical protein ACUVXJ_00730 [Phycisphaerae bacterium]
MQRATERETETVRKTADAMLESLIAWDEGRRLRRPVPPQPQFKLRFPEFPPAPIPKPEPTGDLKPPLADPNQLIGVDKVSELVECSASTVYRLADTAYAPCEACGREVAAPSENPYREEMLICTLSIKDNVKARMALPAPV